MGFWSEHALIGKIIRIVFQIYIKIEKKTIHLEFEEIVEKRHIIFRNDKILNSPKNVFTKSFNPNLKVFDYLEDKLFEWRTVEEC